MSKFNDLLHLRFKQKQVQQPKMTALVERANNGDLSSFSGVFRVTALNEKEKATLKEKELEEIMDAYQHQSLFLMVGYNRRFSPHSVKIANYLVNRQAPIVINYRINAGFVPADHWVHSEEEGGSRVIGE